MTAFDSLRSGYNTGNPEAQGLGKNPRFVIARSCSEVAGFDWYWRVTNATAEYPVIREGRSGSLTGALWALVSARREIG